MEEFIFRLITFIITIVLEIVIEEFINISLILRNLATFLGVVFGGWWTYLIFVKQRLNYPKIDLELKVRDVLLPAQKRLIRVAVKIKNIGNIILNSEEAEIWLQQILPIHEALKNVTKGKKFLDNNNIEKGEIRWPTIDEYTWKWDEKRNNFSKIWEAIAGTNEEPDYLEIEPGESDTIHVDFIIPDDIQVIQLYFFIRNSAKRKKDLSWPITKIHEITSTKEKHMAEKQKGSVKKQQKPKKNQQKPKKKPQ